MEITGLGFSFLGAAILAVNAYIYTRSDSCFTVGSMTDRLRRPIFAIVGLVILTIGFGLQLVAALLTL